MSPDPRPTLDAPDDDPRLWLEDIDAEASLAWVAQQNAATLARFGDAQFEAGRDTLTAIFDRRDNIPIISRRGGLIYNFWRDDRNKRGLWRRTTMAEFPAEAPSWEVLIDLDALAEAEGEDWVWGGPQTLAPDHQRAMIRLSRGGSDAGVLREFDLPSKSFLVDGFHLPEAKGGVEWLDTDTLLMTSSHGGEANQTRSGYARTVRLWQRGTSPSDAPVLFEVDAGSVCADVFVDDTADEERVLFADRKGFFESDLWLGDRTGPKTRLDIPADAWFSVNRDRFVLKLRSAWTRGGETYPPDTLLGGRLGELVQGAPRFAVLFRAEDRIALRSFTWSGGRLVLSILDELSPRYELLTPGETEWRRESIAGLPETGVVSAWRLDIEETESNGDLIALIEDPLAPPSLNLIARDGPPSILKHAPAVFDASGLTVTRHEARSIDGERIPYVQIGPAGLTGDAPVLMMGYGGFQIAMEPHYDPSVGKLWLERGGTYVIAHIRGGGEFGTRWHKAGMREGKRLSHDDFAAVAADLVERGVTRPKRIAAEGGSNGGILISNMLTRYPQRFGALFCTVPLIDMRRYTRLLAGPSWIDEYGDPDKPEDWAFLRTYSAYHNAVPGQSYPPILIATSRKDDRVHPGHARKLAAKLQEMGYEAYFYEPETGGHARGKDSKERAAFTALGLRFLREKIGWQDA